MPPKGKDKDKDKPKRQPLSLYSRGTPYKFGCLCTFCNKLTAVLHCPECPDFFCKDCDITAHSTAKRKDHVRFKLSKLSLAQAAIKITHFIRLVQHLRRCMILARRKIRRYFDKRTLNHYYFNTIYGTTAWRKPYCLRSEELFPFWEPDYAAQKMQNMMHLWRARVKVRAKLVEYYRKIFSRSNGRFYYAWHGPSKLLPKSSWRIPKLCGKRGYPKDIKPIFTNDVAAIVIQRKWRACCVRAMLCALCRGAYDQLWDPVNGRFTYFHRDSEILYLDKPKLLRSQRWDPNYVPDWNPEEVVMFMRRIGLKQYAKNMYEYGIDGKTLTLLDAEDFDNLNIVNRVHVRKVQVEVERRMGGPIKRERVSEAHMMRKEKIRKIKLFNLAALSIQSRFRIYLAKKEVWLRKEMIRLANLKAEIEAEVSANGVWWPNRKDIPSRDPLLFSAINLDKYYAEVAAEEFRLGIVKPVKPKMQLDVLKNPRERFELPQINMKTFGRKKHHETVSKGWGSFLPNLGFTSLDLTAGLNMKNFLGSDNVTKACTMRLHRKGYDHRRVDRFLGVHVHVHHEEKKEEKKEESGDGDAGDEFAEEDAQMANAANKAKKEEAAKKELSKLQTENQGKVAV